MARRAYQLEFRIDALKPETLPVDRLAAYLTELSRFLGNPPAVHFRNVAKGSACLRLVVEQDALPEVVERLRLVENEIRPDAENARQKLNRMLREDNASGRLRSFPAGKVILFPGRKAHLHGDIVIHEAAEIRGRLVRLGGKDATIPVWLRDHRGVILKCTAREKIAKKLSKHYLEDVCVSGNGRWRRIDGDGWIQESFRILEIVERGDKPLAETMKGIGEAIASAWDVHEDPIAEWQRMRG